MVMPLDLLEQQLNQRLHVLLKDGRVMEGKLVGYDQYMNLVLEEADERVSESTKRLGMIVLRGNNIVSMGQPREATRASTGESGETPDGGAQT